MKVAVVGANGFVGAAVAKAVEHSGKHSLIKLCRGDDVEPLLKPVDVVIHAANPAARFSAGQDQEKDFIETVEKTALLLKYSQGKKFVLVSSLSCRTQMDLAYGRHRRACELMALAQGATVVRLGPMFGGDRAHDTLHDIILGKPVYVASETRYAYVDVSWSAEAIVACINEPSKIVEKIARNSVSLNEIAERFSSKSDFCGQDDTQIAIEKNVDAPDAKLVLPYADKEFERMKETASNCK